MTIIVPIVVNVPDDVEDVRAFLDECSVIVCYRQDGDDLHTSTLSEEYRHG